jgi:hypothetical protein
MSAATVLFGCSAPSLDVGSNIVWSTDFESGDFSAWSAPPGTGGAYVDTGGPDTPSIAITTEQAHSGRYSAKLTSTAAPPESPLEPNGAGMYKQGTFPQAAYYSVWYYVPQVYPSPAAWDILRLNVPEAAPDASAEAGGPSDASTEGGTLSLDASAEAAPDVSGEAGTLPLAAPDGSAEAGADASAQTEAGVAPLPDPGANIPNFIDLSLEWLPDGTMTIRLVDGRHQYLTSPLPDPVPAIPIGQWFQIECFYDSAADSTGRLTVWLQGIPIYDLQRPMSGTPAVFFTACSYADETQPTVIYIDDVAISSVRVTPEGRLTVPP